MAKQGLTTKVIPNLVDKYKTWAICVGSGVSTPIFPLWEDLAKRILLHCEPTVSYDDISKKMSPEVVIQAAVERAGKSHEEFAKELADTLYVDLYKGLTTDELTVVKQCLTNDPGAGGVDWGRYLRIIQKKAPKGLTALSLAKSILKLRDKGHGPSSILSFNAEMLMGSLMNAVAHERYKESKKFFDYMIDPTSYHEKDRIPYYFCHGVMPVPETKSRTYVFNADEKLVFMENEYLQLANSSYSWQSSAFINTLTNHTVFFVGLSFVDPNIRRWLAWIQEERLRAIQKLNPNGNVSTSSTSHYWIEKKPGNSIQMRMMESSVSHLGIRIIWVEDWNEVSTALEKGIVI